MLKKLTVVAAVSIGFVATAQAPQANKSAKAEMKDAKMDAKAEMKDAKAEVKDAKAAAAQGPAMPVMTAEGKRWIESFHGKWKGDATLKMGEQSMVMKGEINCEKASGGWATLCKGKLVAKGMPAVEISYLYGFNLGDNTAHMYEVTSMGEVHDHQGKWTDEKTITVAHKGKNAEGKEETDSVTYAWVSPKEFTLKGEGTVMGATTWTLSGSMKK